MYAGLATKPELGSFALSSVMTNDLPGVRAAMSHAAHDASVHAVYASDEATTHPAIFDANPARQDDSVISCVACGLHDQKSQRGSIPVFFPRPNCRELACNRRRESVIDSMLSVESWVEPTACLGPLSTSLKC